MNKPGHFHFHAERILARPGRNSAVDASQYIHRLRERDLRDRHRNPVRNASSYMRRLGELKQRRDDEVAYEGLIFPPDVRHMTRKELWAAVDPANRGKNGEYRRHGGRLPALALFINASFPKGIEPHLAQNRAHYFAYWLAVEHQIAVEYAVHRVNGEIDHCHFILTDRTVTRDGIGKKIRALNGLAELLSGDGGLEVEGGRRVASALEKMRARWAADMRSISGDKSIDHRSYQRRGLNIEPAPHVSRRRIDREMRAGTDNWRTERRRFIQARAKTSAVADTAPHAMSPAIAPSTASAASFKRVTSAPQIMPVAPVFQQAVAPNRVAHVETSDDLPIGVTSAKLEQLLKQLSETRDPLERLRLEEEIRWEKAALRARHQAEIDRREDEDRRKRQQAVSQQADSLFLRKRTSGMFDMVPSAEIRQQTPVSPDTAQKPAAKAPASSPVTTPKKNLSPPDVKTSQPTPAAQTANTRPPASSGANSGKAPKVSTPVPQSPVIRVANSQKPTSPSSPSVSIRPDATPQNTRAGKLPPSTTTTGSPREPGRDRNDTIKYAAALHHQRRLTSPILDSLAEMVATDRDTLLNEINNGGKSLFDEDKLSPRTVIQTALASATARGNTELLELGRRVDEVERAKSTSPAQKTHIPAKDQGRDGW